MLPTPGEFVQSHLEPPATNAESFPTIREEAYVLGAGDEIQIDSSNVPQLSDDNGAYSVLHDGSLKLPWIGKVAVAGLTLEEAAYAIALQCTDVHNPQVSVSLLMPRPMQIAIVGEVSRPGAYTTDQAVQPEPTGVNTPLRSGRLRTVVEAIQTAGGITPTADISKIEVHRSHLNGVEEIVQINLWMVLQESSHQAVVLQDGDTLYIPTATALNPQELQALTFANILLNHH